MKLLVGSTVKNLRFTRMLVCWPRLVKLRWTGQSPGWACSVRFSSSAISWVIFFLLPHADNDWCGAIGLDGGEDAKGLDFLGVLWVRRTCRRWFLLAYSPGHRDDGIGGEYVPVELEVGGEAGHFDRCVVVFDTDQRPHVSLLGDLP